MKQKEIITFGCRLNIFESEVIREHYEKARLKNTIIINTCAVTSEAVRQARQKIRNTFRKNPNHKIVVTGCAAQLDPKSFSKMPEVYQVLGNKEKLQFSNYKAINTSNVNELRVAVSNIMEKDESAQKPILGFGDRSRAFVQIQQGCDHRCTFCIIPFARGENRSVLALNVVEQIKNLVRGGFREVVLTGVDICSYGVDLCGKSLLSDLIRLILADVPELQRLRLSSLDPASVGDDFFDILRDDKRLMPHLHFSLQSMDDMILKRMRRRHTSVEMLELANKARVSRPDIVFGADIIAGFPTENEKMFRNSLEGIKALGITYLHVFPFSARKGTPASKMPAIDHDVRKNRAGRLRDIGESQKQHFYNTLVGSSQEVIMEKNNRGLTQHFASIVIETSNFKQKNIKPGDLVTVKITNIRDGNPIGVVQQ